MPTNNLQSVLLSVLLFLVLCSVSTAQETGFKRWHYTKDGEVVKFTAKFVGLSEENAVFANRKGKLAEIPLEALTRESLEDLVVMHAPALQQPNVNAEAPQEQNQNGDVPRWKRKLSSDLDRAVAKLEKDKRDIFKGSEKWNENTVREAEKNFDTVISSQLIECIVPCEIVNISAPDRSKYKTTLSVPGAGEFTQYFEKRREGSRRYRSYRTIADPNVDIGSKVKLTCHIGLSKSDPYKPKNLTGTFGVSNYQRQTALNLDAKFSPLLGTSVSLGDQTYYLIYRGFHVE